MAAEACISTLSPRWHLAAQWKSGGGKEPRTTLFHAAFYSLFGFYPFCWAELCCVGRGEPVNGCKGSTAEAVPHLLPFRATSCVATSQGCRRQLAAAFPLYCIAAEP